MSLFCVLRGKLHEDSVWGNNSPFKKKESVTDSNKNEESDNGQTESYVPAQEVKPSESSAKPAPTVNLSHNPGYIIQKRKISPILIIVIIALVLIIGILCGMLFMSSRNKKESNSRKNSIGSDVEISENEAIETTTKTTKKPITETTTTANTTEKVTETTTAPQHVDTMNAAKKTMYAHLDEQLQIEQSEDISHFDRNPKYAMYDVNGDGIDELFISYDNMESTGSDLYIYNNGEYIKSHRFYTGAKICLSEHLIREDIYGGGEMTKIYVISDNSILQKDEISNSITQFQHNDYTISEQEYNSLLSKYEALDWIHVPDNSDYISNLIDMSAYDPYADIKQEIINSVDNEYYAGQDSHIENAPSDMVFYSAEKRSWISINNPIVYEGPGTLYMPITVYESGFTIFGENDGWYYIQWYDGSGMFSHPCYGYVSKGAQNDKYTTYDTSAAGSDFDFYNRPPYSYGHTVATESDPLNLRAAPSTDADIIMQIPKGAAVGEYGCNGEWSYISYTVNGETYFGYVSSQYLH